MKFQVISKIIFAAALCMALAFPHTVFASGQNTGFFLLTPGEGSRNDTVEERIIEDAVGEDLPEPEIPEDLVVELSEKTSEGVNSDGYYVLNLSAETIAQSKKPIGTLIQALLTEARDHATDELPYKIIVEPGSYTLTRRLCIYSNTCLYLDGVTFTMDADTNIIRVATGTDTHTGYYFRNITIDGGKNGCVLDKNCTACPSMGTGIKICHTENFLMKNVTVMNVENAHMMEVAGVKDFTLKNCVFQNQSVNNGYYEAVQLDVLVPGHIKGYTYEVLPCQNLTFDRCTFYNVPRAIGSHTSILNCPVDGLTVKNCGFVNTDSAAIQLIDVNHFTAAGNNFTNVPRAISLYALQLGGTFLPSAVAASGNTTTNLPDTYRTPPQNQNIVIKNNYIKCSGEDAFDKDYEECGILISGNNLSGGYSGTNPIPAGNYYISGIKIIDNEIYAGNGILLKNVRNASVTKNKLYYSSSLKKSYRGIYAGNGCETLTFSNNEIQYFPTAGIHCDTGNGIRILKNKISPKGDGIRLSNTSQCTVKSNTVNNMGVKNPDNHGINVLDYSSVNSITANTVQNYHGNGISVTSGASVVTISKNKITSAANSGIFVEWASVSDIKENTIQNSCRSKTQGAIHVGGGGKVSSLKKNTIKNSFWFGIQVEVGEVADIAANKVKAPGSYGIVVYSGQYGTANVKTIRQNTITNGKDIGIYIANTKGELTLSSNTVKKCGTAQIYINRTASSPYVVISDNKLTGTAETDGIRADEGNVRLSSNQLASCRYAILLKNTGIKAEVQPNTYQNNKYNAVKYYCNNEYGDYTDHPAAPAFLNALTKGKKKIQISWNAVSNAQGYLIYCSTKKGSGYTLAGNVSSKKTAFTVKKLKPNKKYYFKVLAYTKSPDGCVHICSNDSSIIYQKTAK